MRLARWVFLLAGVSGAIMMLPLYFMEEKLGRDLPPTVNHPELYYGFIGVTLAWQFMFLVIARDPIRYRSAMLPALFEKASYAGALLALFARNRVPDEMLAFAAMDATWFVLFAIAYWRTNSTPNTEQSRRPAMNDDFASLFAFNRWANSKMLDACRKLTPEQYSAEPVPGWSSVRVTVWHIAVVTDGCCAAWSMIQTKASRPRRSSPRWMTPSAFWNVRTAVLTNCCRHSRQSDLQRPSHCNGAADRRHYPHGSCCGTSSITRLTTVVKSRPN